MSSPTETPDESVMSRWQREADRSRGVRGSYRRLMTSRARRDPVILQASLEEIFVIISGMPRLPNAYPEVQRELHDRAVGLLDQFLALNLKHRHGNRRVPSGKVLNGLIGEAKWLVDVGVRNEWIVRHQRGISNAEFREMVRLWVERSVSLNATPRDVEKIEARCLSIVRRRTGPALRARQLVAAVLGISEGTLRRTWARRHRE